MVLLLSMHLIGFALAGSVGEGVTDQPPNGSASTDAAREAPSLGQDLKADLAGRMERSENHGNVAGYCIRRLSELGECGVAPLCQAVDERAWASTSIGALAAMLNDQPGRRRPGPPIARDGLTDLDLAALTRIVQPVKALASRTPDQRSGDREACLSLLLSIAPRVKPAEAALIDLMMTDPVLPDARARMAALLAEEDAGSRRKFEAASLRGKEAAKEVVRLVNLLSLPPAKAAVALQSLDPAEKTTALLSLGDTPKLAPPILIELLADPKVNDFLLRRRGDAVYPEIRKALVHPNRLVRIRAALLLPDSEMASTVETLAGALGLSDGPVELPEQLHQALSRIGDPAIPPISSGHGNRIRWRGRSRHGRWAGSANQG